MSGPNALGNFVTVHAYSNQNLWWVQYLLWEIGGTEHPLVRCFTVRLVFPQTFSSGPERYVIWLTSSSPRA